MLDLNLGLARLPFDDRINVVCCSGSDRNCVSCICLLHEGISAVRLGQITSVWFRFACSFGSLLGRRSPVSTLFSPSSCGAVGASCTESCASDFVMELLLGLMVLVAGAVQLDGNSTVHVGPSSEGSTAPTVPVAGREPSLDTSSALRQDAWAQAAERYGLFRPSPEETAIVVHRQTTQRWAVTPEGWDEIPVHPDMRPEEILADIAYWHTDLRAFWEQVEWWLYRVHASSRSSSQPVLDRTNYVLIRGDDFLAGDMRPHGLVELVFGEDLILFSTFFPRWVNLSILYGPSWSPSFRGRTLGRRCAVGTMEAKLGLGPYSVKMAFTCKSVSSLHLSSSVSCSAVLPCMLLACIQLLITRGEMMCSGRLCTLREVIP